MALFQATLVQWQNSRLPRGRPGFDSRTLQFFFSGRKSSSQFISLATKKIDHIFKGTIKYIGSTSLIVLCSTIRALKESFNSSILYRVECTENLKFLKILKVVKKPEQKAKLTSSLSLIYLRPQTLVFMAYLSTPVIHAEFIIMRFE